MMAESHDGCMHRAGMPKVASGPATKEAGISLYLMEELGDARLHCAQLSHYIDLARQIVEKSQAKDHIYEVAGHLLQAIPEHLFKLEKSLQAVALAADRMDYEEIKTELKPDKVQELERVLKEVRIRTVPHRSEPRPPMNPTQASEELKKIAATIRTTGKVPVDRVSALLDGLEGQEKTASDTTPVAELLEGMATSLAQSNKPPSRLHLAATLRKVLADSCMNGCNLMSGETTEEEAARRSRFEKGQPADPTQNMDPEQKKEWEAKNEEHGDKFKEAALDPGPMPRMELIKSDVIVAWRRGGAGNWRLALMGLVEAVENIGYLLRELGGGDDGLKKAAILNREIIRVRRTVRMTGVEIMHDEMNTLGYTASDKTAYVSPDPDKLWKMMHDSVEALLDARVKSRKLHEALQTVLEDASGAVFTGNYQHPEVKALRDNLYDLDHAIGVCYRNIEALERGTKRGMNGIMIRQGADENYARFEEGKPADPTENMDSEDAAKWKQKNEEHGDKFKEASDPLKTALARLSVAKKAEAAMSVSEAEKLASSAMHLEKEAHDLFDEAQRTKADYYNPIDPTLVDRLRDLHGEVVRGLSALSRIDSKGAAPILTKDLSTFGRMNLSPDTLSEAAGLAYVINNKALLVLHKARRAAQQIRFYTNWIASYKATGSSPSLEDQWEWLRTAAEWKVSSGRTKHLPGKPGHTLCGETARKDTLVDSVKDSDCHYCVQAWKKSHGGLTASDWKASQSQEQD